jgi:hypothetical protein
MRFREGRATVVLPGGFPFTCENSMYAPDAPRSLISYRDMRARKIHISTEMEKYEEVLVLRQGHELLATAKAGAEGLYTIVIKPMTVSPISPIDAKDVSMAAWARDPEAKSHHLAQGVSLDTVAKPDLWHRRLGHPGTTLLRRMLPLITGHNLLTSDAAKTNDCVACIQGKYIKKPSTWTLPKELPPPLYRLHGDVCGPINPPSGVFKYYFVLIDAYGSHLEVSLLPTKNMVFPRILAILLRYHNHFPEYPIKYLRMDNAQEFCSHAFEDYCSTMGITLTYYVPYEHSQNGLAEAFIKKIQLIARPLLLHAKLPSHLWGHAVLHATALLRLRPTLLNVQTPYELVAGRPPDVSHMRTFGCQVWVPVTEPRRHTIGTHRQEGIYIGFYSTSIIRYLDPQTGNLLRARFANCRFIETTFPALRYKPNQANEPINFTAPKTLTMNHDLPTSLANTEVVKLMNLKALAENTLDGFSSEPRIIRHPLPGTGNTLPKRKPTYPISQPDPTKRPKVHFTVEDTSADVEDIEDRDVHFGQISEPTIQHQDSDPTTLKQAMGRPNWPEWQATINTEYASLRKHQVFGELSLELDKPPVGYKLIFTCKFDAHGNVSKYKARLVAQGFTQRPGVDYVQTYSPVMDTTSFRYLLALKVHLSLRIYLLDVVTAYLHGTLDYVLYLAPPPGFLNNILNPKPDRFA